MAERHPLSWAAIAVAAAAASVACFLPAFELAVEAIIGADEEQEAFRYTSELTLAGDLRPLGLLPLAAALALLGLAAAALVRGAAPWLVVASFALACCLVLLVFDVEDRRLEWPGDSGVIGYDEPNEGPLLAPGLDDLRAAAARSPEAQRPGWDPGDANSYAARGLVGWRLFTWAAVALAWLTAYRAARLGLGVRASVLVVVVTTLAIGVVLVLRFLSGLE